MASVLDEALIYAAGAKGHMCVTGEITVRYVKPARTGVAYALEGPLPRGQGPHRPGRERPLRLRRSRSRQGDGQALQDEALTACPIGHASLFDGKNRRIRFGLFSIYQKTNEKNEVCAEAVLVTC
ncbi:MAG: hypothetical protein MZU79_04480 [Anaerotruncus sp.]|nr:hypothetical protein [Anaerotruncus sp.]